MGEFPRDLGVNEDFLGHKRYYPGKGNIDKWASWKLEMPANQKIQKASNGRGKNTIFKKK